MCNYLLILAKSNTILFIVIECKISIIMKEYKKILTKNNLLSIIIIYYAVSLLLLEQLLGFKYYIYLKNLIQ